MSTCHQERGTIHSGETPLIIASRGGHVDIVRLLIEAKAQVNKQKEVWLLLPPETHCTTHHHTQCYYNSCTPQSGSTALHMAAYQGKVNVVRV